MNIFISYIIFLKKYYNVIELTESLKKTRMVKFTEARKQHGFQNIDK